MRRTRAAFLVFLAFAASVTAQDADSTPKPERFTTCWDCHQVTQGDAPPLATFANLMPPSEAGAALGEPFDYVVRVQNAWMHEARSARVELNLTNAPSLAFASDIDRLREVLDGVIEYDAAAAAEPQQAALTYDIPFGHTHLEVRLRPSDTSALGPDLALLVYPGRSAAEGDAIVVDAARRGGEEVFVVADRQSMATYGYGNWTFAAQARFLPDDPTLGPALPIGMQVPFEIQLDAFAEPSVERVAAVGNRALVPAGSATQLPFRLVGVGVPGANESVAVKVDLWAHYRHATVGQDDDENATKEHPRAIPVVDGGGFPVLRPEVKPGTDVFVGVHNGPTMATLSEAVGYAAAFLLVASIVSGGLFGKASRRGLNALFGTAKRRVGFHNFLSYGLTAAALGHLVLFIVEAAFHWTLGLIWGGLAILALLGLGVTGAIQVPLVRAWGYAGWRWTHFALALAALAFTLAHALLDGVHFAGLQEALGWGNPLEPAPTA